MKRLAGIVLSLMVTLVQPAEAAVEGGCPDPPPYGTCRTVSSAAECFSILAEDMRCARLTRGSKQTAWLEGAALAHMDLSLKMRSQIEEVEHLRQARAILEKLLSRPYGSKADRAAWLSELHAVDKDILDPVLPG